MNANDFFRSVLLTVVGQAYTAAGYLLEERPLQWNNGLFRFAKALNNGLHGYIEYQALTYVDTEYSAGQPSRFRVHLIRSDQPNATSGAHYVKRSLSALVVTDFAVTILPNADHWWTYKDTQGLGKALAEAGHLTIGYGIPWLAGELLPPS